MGPANASAGFFKSILLTAQSSSRHSLRQLPTSLCAQCANFCHPRRSLMSQGYVRQGVGTVYQIPRTPSTWRRPFSTTRSWQSWLQPKRPEKRKSMVGRPRMPTGGSMRGTTVVWGEYGLRMKDHDRRVSAKQLKIGEDAIRKRLRGLNYKLYTRVSANIGVYTHGNEVRMGKGKGKFDYWASRIPVSRVVFELKGDFHEKVAREAFRLAGHKMPGLYEFVKKGDAPMVGVTKLREGITLQSLKDARRDIEPKDREPQPIIPSTSDAPPATVSTSL